jgi:hypothetical protein
VGWVVWRGVGPSLDLCINSFSINASKHNAFCVFAKKENNSFF